MKTAATTHLRFARSLTHLLDSRFSLFGFRFGLDPILDIIPGIGTLVPTLLSGYLIWIGIQLEMPSKLLTQMIINVIVDGILGSIPVVGLVADAFFKANEKNLKILETYLDGSNDPRSTERIVT
ncbi:DUF4112 domain-containing protein [Candidatus Woesebacteria bacterium]|nr:DUF4112 domain-containing protein [Candidatus Woesebacteria bacterium]